MASILSIASVLGGEMTDVITWFQTRGLLAQNKSCNHNMDMQTRSDITDKYRYIVNIYIEEQI